MSLLYFGTAQSTLLRNLEVKTLDLRFHLRGVKSPTSGIVLVVIDDRSIAELGRWPWSRRRFAEIIQPLRQAGARVIVFDLLFTESETDAEPELLRRWRQLIESAHPGLSEASWQQLQQLWLESAPQENADLTLARSLRETGNAVLAFAAVLATLPPTDHVVPPTPPPTIARNAYRVLHGLSQGSPSVPLIGNAIMAPIPMLAQESAALGHSNVAFDSDGTPRNEYPVLRYAGDYYPSLAVQAARVFLGLAAEDLRVFFGEGIQLGNIFIPTDESMRLMVNYLGPRGTFPTYAFVDVLQGRVPPSQLKDAIVLIGGVATGLADTFVTPFEAALPGVERHATVLDNILRRDFLHRREATVWVDLACLMVLGLLVGWISPHCPTFWGSLVAVGLGGGYVIANVLTFIWAGLWVNLLFPLLALLLSQSSVTLFNYLTEERQKRLIREAFHYYLHPAVVEQVSRQPHLLKLGGEAREMTVLFSDIRGFSTVAESLPPEPLVYLLNDYLTAMTRIVFRHQGLLDKYIGDGIMAVYGAPLHHDMHALQACETALDMVDELGGLQAQWAARGLPPLRIGIGINTATMVVGNMGSKLRFDYTVMGDGVNLASRLEGANKIYGTSIVISESTWQQVRDRCATRELDCIRVKGKAQATRIFEVLGWLPLPAERAALIQSFAAGLAAYRTGDWSGALGHFQHTLEIAPGDGPSQTYVRRCREFMRSPPSATWDGVYTIDST